MEQGSDPTLLNFGHKTLAFDEQVHINDARYLHYSRHEKRIIIKVDITIRQYYYNLGEVSHLKIRLPGQLLQVLL